MSTRQQFIVIGVSFVICGCDESATSTREIYSLKSACRSEDAPCVASADAGVADATLWSSHFGNELSDWDLFTTAQLRWKQQFQAWAQTDGGNTPYPPFQSPLNRKDLYMNTYFHYLSSLVTAYGFDVEHIDYMPFGPIPSPYGVAPGDEATLRRGGALILAADAPEDLYRMTDFSGVETTRFSQACMMYLAYPYRDRTTYRPSEICNELGSVVPYTQIQRVQVEDARLMTGRDCGLPSALFGEYSPGTESSWHYTWPDYSLRSVQYAEPCVVNFLRLRVTDLNGNIHRGWVPQKAVANYMQFEFPYSWSDPENAMLPDRRGVNRPAYLSKRLLFEDGIALYLGNAPLWVVTLEQLLALWTDPSGTGLSELLLGPTTACDADDPLALSPCRLPRQQPFLFPNLSIGLWVVDALDSGHPNYNPDNLGGNPIELTGVFPADNLTSVWNDTISFFKFRAEDTADWAGAAEQLSAIWHSLTNHNKNWERYRMAIVPLDETEQTLLLIPDQGYFQLGIPSIDLVDRMLSADLAIQLSPAQLDSEALYAFKPLFSNNLNNREEQ